MSKISNRKKTPRYTTTKIERKNEIPSDVRKGTAHQRSNASFNAFNCQFGMVKLTLIAGQIIRIPRTMLFIYQFVIDTDER